MNLTLAAAAALTALIGAIHSALGERLIFGLPPGSAADAVTGRYRGILRASWHATTLFGWALAAVLAWFAVSPLPFPAGVRAAAVAATGLSSLLVLLLTRGRHPGWIGLAGATALCAAA
jgi:hypothetical protein